jgi:VWFA-related protein
MRATSILLLFVFLSSPASAAVEEAVAASSLLDATTLAEVGPWLWGDALPASWEQVPDPDPTTATNELLEGITRRHAMAVAEGWTPVDDRFRMLFLNGVPRSRLQVDCAETFQPLELWTYPGQTLLLTQPRTQKVMRMWLPIDGKAGLYVREMEFWLEQWHDYPGNLPGKRFDRILCPESEQVDRITGTDGLLGSPRFKPPRPNDLLPYLAPPSDLAAWAREASAEDLVVPPLLPVLFETPRYPRFDGGRILTKLVLTVPPEVILATETDEVTSREVIRMLVSGTIEHQGNVLESVRARFELPIPDGPRPEFSLVLERPLRPGLDYRVRLDVADSIGPGRRRLVFDLAVPRQPVPEPELSEEAARRVELRERIATERVQGIDSVLLLPPTTDVVFGNWRAEAVVTGLRIQRVAFSVDGKVQLTRRSPPYTVDLGLPIEPQVTVVRAEGFDSAGELVAADELVLNQPRGELALSIVEPARGATLSGAFTVAVEIVVPEERSVESLELALSDGTSRRLERPPWRAELPMPTEGDLVWVTATAALDDGSTAEDTRFLRVPAGFDQVDVRLVELYTTVVGNDRNLVRGLQPGDFVVREDGRVQEVSKFELVENLPLTVGLTLDLSGSMAASLGEAQRAIEGFLENVIGPLDRTFAVGFANEPALLMGLTSDAGAIDLALRDLAAEGATALHDSVIFSLYHFRGVLGRKILILLSDGDDTSSRLDWDAALAYAQRSGVMIYTVGLKNQSLGLGARRKLSQLAESTGGRAFFIAEAEELASVYAEIEAEFRSQYLIAYSPDRAPSPGFRKVEVQVKRSGLTVRTIPGYVP